MTWKDDKRWSDKFLPEIKRILGEFLLTEPEVEEDELRNTDLTVLKMDTVRIGCRVRRHKFLKYKNDFTIRAGRPNGNKTELSKIIEGWGDYLFYGFCDEHEERLSYWFIGDLKVFRLWYMRKLILLKGEPPGLRHNNVDGSSFFYCFEANKIQDFIKSASLKGL
jgi:hypothetical protein